MKLPVLTMKSSIEKTMEIIRLTQENHALLQRLHTCKRDHRRNRDRLRRDIATLKSTVKCWYNAYVLLDEQVNHGKSQFQHKD